MTAKVFFDLRAFPQSGKKKKSNPNVRKNKNPELTLLFFPISAKRKNAIEILIGIASNL